MATSINNPYTPLNKTVTGFLDKARKEAEPLKRAGYDTYFFTFFNPIPKGFYLDYNEYVPKDREIYIMTIRGKAAKSRYRSMDEFMDDIRQISENARLYHTQGEKRMAHIPELAEGLVRYMQEEVDKALEAFPDLANPQALLTTQQGVDLDVGNPPPPPTTAIINTEMSEPMVVEAQPAANDSRNEMTIGQQRPYERRLSLGPLRLRLRQRLPASISKTPIVVLFGAEIFSVKHASNRRDEPNIVIKKNGTIHDGEFLPGEGREVAKCGATSIPAACRRVVQSFVLSDEGKAYQQRCVRLLTGYDISSASAAVTFFLYTVFQRVTFFKDGLHTLRPSDALSAIDEMDQKSLMSMMQVRKFHIWQRQIDWKSTGATTFYGIIENLSEPFVTIARRGATPTPQPPPNPPQTTAVVQATPRTMPAAEEEVIDLTGDDDDEIAADCLVNMATVSESRLRQEQLFQEWMDRKMLQLWLSMKTK